MSGAEYESFAYVYDKLMLDMPYGAWIDNVREIWREAGLDFRAGEGLVLELGCGTGNLTIPLARLGAELGFEMIGIDKSPDMLSVAKLKASQSNQPEIMFLQGDMRSFELYGTVDSIVCICDGMNYITSEQDLLRVFALVKNYLNPGGVFIFDLNTSRKYKKYYGKRTFSYADEDMAYIWQNNYNNKRALNTYYIDFFVKTESGFYNRFEEKHKQRAYEVDQIKAMLATSGLYCHNIWQVSEQSGTMEVLTEDADRLLIWASK